MKKTLAIGLICLISTTPVIADDNTERVAKSKTVIKEFFGELKGQLVGALKSGGPDNAISVCNKVAPEIAKKISAKHGLEIARTSLKTRNSNNKPDAWEEKVLKSFEARKAAGEDPQKIAYSEVVNEGGKKVFRFMKAIPTAKKPCLMCHGTNIKPELITKLDSLYPGDMARGYKAGDIRGAFTIKQPM